ncbi:GntR family transcriptional regulator [Cohaesibacter gelatinilyticus]|uniref:Transcriptional regulator, GntR family n=1 Tax=Cohaesibacter gelatinilyticus TaxID=372072 RepID=A0A285NKJ1_9HYPH|nr:GntR family transcriptional regulator [Cohaesibacter gelatinilyticus]SNZ08396.1 transcriptional regulator, GntR family [Cohaesibacter gelatinilyticus]
MFGRQKEESATVVNLLADQVRRDISFGVLPPDTKLKIEELRGRYGGSAHSLREALRLLSNEGLVEATAQRGFRVSSATLDDQQDIMRLRREIETTGLRWAMEHGDLQWEGRIMAAQHALKAITTQLQQDPTGFALDWDEANRHFHATLIEASRSPRLMEIQNSLFEQSRRFRLAALRESQIDFEATLTVINELVAAILTKQETEAVNILQKLIIH